MTFIFIIVTIVVLIIQNNKISRLEKMINERFEKKQPSAASAPVQTPTSVSASVPDSSSNVPLNPLRNIETGNTETSTEETSGKILGRLGIAAVLIGVAFFLKYAFDNNWVGPTGRVMIGIIAGLAFLAVGQWLREKYLKYSDLLMGGGIAILYLSVFSAHSFYNLIDSGMTGILMFCVTALAMVISIVNATQTLALVSVIGGFATPTLVGSHENAMISLFGYLTLLNVGVLFVSFFRKWPRLVVAAYVGTAFNFISWFSAFYQRDELAPTLMFLFISFIIFLVASVARAVTAGIKAEPTDYFLLGVNAFGFAGFGYVVLDPEFHGILGFASVLIALIYAGVAFVANKFNSQDTALNIFLPGLAVVFLSIAVPLQFSGPWIAVAWFVESCFLYVIASMISNRGFQVMGVIVYILGLVNYFFWNFPRSYGTDFVPIANAGFMIIMLAVIVAYAIAYMYRQYGSISTEIQARGITVFVVIANILTVFIISSQIIFFYHTKTLRLSEQHRIDTEQARQYNTGYDTTGLSQEAGQRYQSEITSINNQSNTLVSIFWVLYAALLTAIGFAKRIAGVRRLGLTLFVLTAIKVLIDVWSLGQLYRIISFVVFGVIALGASFAYAKYKDRLKSVLVLVCILSFSLIASTVHASFSQTDWQYVRSLTPQTPVTSAQSTFLKVTIPSDISRTSSNFVDLRIVNQNGVESPYVMSRNTSVHSGSVSPQLLNMTQSGTTQFVADLGKSGIITTGIQINGNLSNYRRQVSIYASPTLIDVNSRAWRLVTDRGYIYRFTDPYSGYSSGKDDISFSAQTSRYFKVVVNGGDEGALGISSVTTYGDVTTNTPSQTMTLPVSSVTNNASKRSTEVTVDLGREGILTDAITLNSSDRNYNRRVIIETSSDMSHWSTVGQGSISSVQTSLFEGISNRVTFPEQKSRYIRISIVNDDNRPLVIGNNVIIEGPIISIIYEARAGETYSLYYGNPRARQPVYDISSLSQYVEEFNLPIAVVGEEMENPNYFAPAGPVIPFTEKNKYLLNVLLVVVVIVIGAGIAWYLMKYVKKA